MSKLVAFIKPLAYLNGDEVGMPGGTAPGQEIGIPSLLPFCSSIHTWLKGDGKLYQDDELVTLYDDIWPAVCCGDILWEAVVLSRQVGCHLAARLEVA